MRVFLFSASFIIALLAKPLFANIRPASLSDRLTQIRSQEMNLEKGIIDSLKLQNDAKGNIKRIQALMKLQKEEGSLTRGRLAELSRTVSELETRRTQLREKIRVQHRGIRKNLAELDRALDETPHSTQLREREELESPRRKVISLLADRGVKEIETLKVDLADADQLEEKISDEKNRLAYVFQDLKEQESILELNRQLQLDLLQKKHHERLSQLENYRNLKVAESRVENLIDDFNSRKELEKSLESERLATRSMMDTYFGKQKGKLKMPIGGAVVSQFGPQLDRNTQLQIFKKGIEISGGKKVPVRAVAGGKVAYVGELPDYGRVTIIDHGDHFYSLCARLGDQNLKQGDPIQAGDILGNSDDAGSPVYFEIRARNIAVNPLQWVAN